jgi:hypothetical protein
MSNTKVDPQIEEKIEEKENATIVESQIKTDNLAEEDSKIEFAPATKVEIKEENTVNTTQNQRNNWKPIALATILGLAVAIAIIGFQSFQVQSQSEKIRNLETKAVNEQKNLGQIETLNQQVQTLTQESNVNKSDLEQKTKLLSDFQEKANDQADIVKAKDTQITKLETENKNLAAKNTTLTTENAGLKESAVSIRDRINTLFAPKR